jgi:hypothetical protein
MYNDIFSFLKSMMANRVRAWLPFLTLLLLDSPTFSQNLSVGYYPSWLRMTLPANKIQFENLTHIVHAFAWPENNGKISLYGDLKYPDLVAATHSAGKKILIALGG